MNADDIRDKLQREHPRAEVEQVELVEGDDQTILVRVHTRRPGLLIGKRAATLERVKAELEAELGAVTLNLIEVR